jgi:hypothetical protein
MDRDSAEVRLAELANDLANGLAGLEALFREAHARTREARERLELQSWPDSQAALGIVRQIVQQDVPVLKECGERVAGITRSLRVGPEELAEIARVVGGDADG